MSARIILVCNRCGAEGRLTPAANLNPTRLKLKKQGWGYWARGVDYCQTCLPTIIAEHKAANPQGYA